MKNTVSLTILGIIICLVTVTSAKADEPCPTPNTATSAITITKMPQGAMPGFFSVAANRKVVFSQGNLQWQGSTNTWRFADEQYEVIGTAAGSANMVFDTTLRKTSEDWIDLFPWASSGYGKAKPYFVHNDPISDYYVEDNYHNPMTGAYANYDWGVYNPITNGGNAAGLWRTLTQAEWNYLINTRTRHDSLWTGGNIRNKENNAYIYGIFIFPDNFVLPEDFTMKFASYESVSFDATTNRLTYSQWKQYEALGVIFLPQCGGLLYINTYKNGFNMTDYYHRYWLADNYNNTCCSYAISIYGYYYFAIERASTTSTSRHYHCSVRLAKTLEEPEIE